MGVLNLLAVRVTLHERSVPKKVEVSGKETQQHFAVRSNQCLVSSWKVFLVVIPHTEHFLSMSLK